MKIVLCGYAKKYAMHFILTPFLLSPLPDDGQQLRSCNWAAKV